MSPTQDDVLAKKGFVLKSSLGLQIWGDAFPDGMGGGEASTGTAERQARIRRLIAGKRLEDEKTEEKERGSGVVHTVTGPI